MVNCNDVTMNLNQKPSLLVNLAESCSSAVMNDNLLIGLRTSFASPLPFTPVPAVIPTHFELTRPQ